MAVIGEGLRKVVDYVVNTFNGGEDDAFVDMVDDSEYGDYDYVEEGSALKKVQPMYEVAEPKKESKVLTHPSINRSAGEMIFLEPHSFDDSALIVEHLKDRKIVMLNLHLLDKNQSQRTIDFVCGAAQALNATPKQVGELVFVFAPSNITLSADTIPQQNKFNDSLWSTALQ